MPEQRAVVYLLSRIQSYVILKNTKSEAISDSILIGSVDSVRVQDVGYTFEREVGTFFINFDEKHQSA